MVDYWRYNTIWYEDIPDNHFLFLNPKVKKENLTDMELHVIKYFVYWHHKKSPMGNFIEFPENLLSLELNWSNIQDFEGIERLDKLKRLELHYCTKLTSDIGLSRVADTLEILHINQSKKFDPSEELLALKNLRVLRLNSCGFLENLDFLKHFPKLIDFCFVDTNVLDGDLTPIVDHPTIRSAGFHNKRHYNFRFEKMKALLNDKYRGREYRSYIQKGKYETFIYID